MSAWRLFPGVVGGFLAAFWLYFVVSLAGRGAQGWILVVGWIVLGVWFARSGYYAWPRVWLVLCLLSFALPLAGIVFAGQLGAQQVSQQASDAGRAGAAIGSAIGGGLVVGALGFVGFFLGVIFAVLAFFTNSGARDRARAAREAAQRLADPPGGASAASPGGLA